jgi:AraC-like DNA-binding protein
MSKRPNILTEFQGLTIIHQKIPQYEVGRHSHDEHEFFLPLQGEISVQYENIHVSAGPGRMLYVPPKTDHSFTSSAQGSGERLIWLISEKLWVKHLGASSSQDTKFTAAAFPVSVLAKELLFYLLIHKKIEGAKYFIGALIESLIDSLNSSCYYKGDIAPEFIGASVKDQRIAKAIEFINESYNSCSLSEVATKSGLSLRNFNRLFLKETGLGPKEYLILCRIEKAKKLLQESKLTVTDIAFEVGYNSLSKFIETFKKIVGSLPSDFRVKTSINTAII